MWCPTCPTSWKHTESKETKNKELDHSSMIQYSVKVANPRKDWTCDWHHKWLRVGWLNDWIDWLETMNHLSIVRAETYCWFKTALTTCVTLVCNHISGKQMGMGEQVGVREGVAHYLFFVFVQFWTDIYIRHIVFVQFWTDIQYST